MLVAGILSLLLLFWGANAAAAAAFPCCESDAALEPGLGLEIGSKTYFCQNSALSLLTPFACTCALENKNCSDASLALFSQPMTFHCSNGRVLSMQQVNDDFCDCGEDEPNTSACSGLTANGAEFYCAASQRVLPTSRVNDGVQDCCDCSDEARNEAFDCRNKNRCAEERALRDKLLFAREEIIRNGRAELAFLVQDAQRKLEEFRAEVDRLQAERSAHGQRLADGQALADRFVQAVMSSNSDVATWIKAASAQGVNAAKATTPAAVFKMMLPARKHRAFYQELSALLCAPTSDADAAAVECAAPAQELSIMLDQLDELLPNTASNTADMDRRITQLDAWLKLDFGPNNTLISLLDRDLTRTQGEHTFTFKAFDSCTQAPGSTSLGKFESWKALDEDDGSKSALPQELNEGEAVPRPSIVMEFTKGQACFQGTIRSTSVYLRCDASTELSKVFEPEMCRYLYLVKTPVACLSGEALTGADASLWRRAKRALNRVREKLNFF